MEDKFYVIFPDIHGRDFWKAVVDKYKDHSNVVFIFLGDYLDPYPHEYISEETAIENFKGILDFANSNKDRVILLLGNHDMSYCGPTWICECRHSYKYDNDIAKLFENNKGLLKIGYILDIPNSPKKILFSHSCLTKSSLSYLVEDGNVENAIKYLNTEISNHLGERSQYGTSAKKLWNYFGMVSGYRGGDNFSGSIIWEDFRAIASNDTEWPENINMIFGHTQLWGTCEVANDKTETWAYDLDIRQAFYLDKDYEPCFESTGKKIKETNKSIKALTVETNNERV